MNLRPEQRNRLYAELRQRLRARARESLEDAARRVLEEGHRGGFDPIEGPTARRILEAARFEGREQWERLRQCSRDAELRGRLLH